MHNSRSDPKLAPLSAIVAGCCLVGLIAIGSSIMWGLRWWQAAPAIFPLDAIHFNFMLDYLVCAGALMLLARGRVRAAAWTAAAAAILVSVVLVESLGTATTGVGVNTPGQVLPALLTGPTGLGLQSLLCLLSSAAATIFCALSRDRSVSIRGVGLTCISVAVAGLSVLVLACAVDLAPADRVTLHEDTLCAIGNLLLAVCLLMWCTQIAWNQRRPPHLWLWVGAAISVCLLADLVVVIAASVFTIDAANRQRATIGRTLRETTQLLGELTDTQRGMRGYILSRRPEALELYQRGVRNIPARISSLAQLTRAERDERLLVATLRDDVDSVIGYSRQLLGSLSDSQAVATLEASGRGLAVMNEARRTLQSLVDAIQRRLDRAAVRTNDQFAATERLLVLGSAMAVAILIWANALSIQLAARREAAEAQRFEAERRSKALLDAIADYAIFMLCPNGYVLSWNAGAERLMGYSAAEIVGRHFGVLYPDVDERARTALEVSAREGRYEEEGWLHRKDGTRLYANVLITTVRDEAGGIVGFANASRDLTLRKAMEEALQEKNRGLQVASEAKDRFLANMSHELRTPLNGILGFSQLLRDQRPGPLNGSQQEYLDHVLQSAHHLLQLINDILDMGKITAGKMQIVGEEFSLSAAIERVCSSLRAAAAAKQIQLNIHLDPTFDSVLLDPQRCRQILFNLLSNAIKFTGEAGSIDVRTRRLDNSTFALDVRDTGVGIAPESLSRLFRDFEQLDNSSTRRYQGTGLGLALTRRLAQLQGGDVSVASTLGKGTEFTVTLPFTLHEVSQ